MAQEYRPIPRVTDALAVKFMEHLQSEIQFSGMAVKLFGSHTLIEYGDKIISDIVNENRYSIERITIGKNVTRGNQNHSFSVEFIRGEPKVASNGHMHVFPSLYVDTIQISASEYVPATDALAIMRLADDILVSRSAPPLAHTEQNDIKSLVDTHHQLISELTQQIATIGTKFTETRLALEKEISERKTDLENEFAEKSSALEEQNKIEREKITQESEDLEQRKKQLDDRGNTHVRREIRQQLREHLKSYRDRFQLTKETIALRRPIYITVIIALLIIIVAISYLVRISIGTIDVWDRVAVLAKTAALTFFGGGLLVWYLKWLSSWSERHANGEFQLRQMELDMERASWLVETAFEWKQTQDTPIPDSLLAALSRNLFSQESEKGEKDVSPADQLASALLGDASRLKVNLPGGSELEFARSALKKAGKSD